MKKVLIFGSFDTLHPGHAFLIKEARKHGEVHVCLALDETIKNIKGYEPINSLEIRQDNLEKLDVKVYPGDKTDRLRVVKELQPDVIVLGYDQKKFVDQLEIYISETDNNIDLKRLPAFHGNTFSSSSIRSAIEDKEARFILIDKQSGISSMRVVSLLRNALSIKRIGFAGTLDPLASGLLICGISKATRLLDWWHVLPKTYNATARLGSVSDTYDSEGKITALSDNKPSKQQIEEELKKFLKITEQVPPAFSAKKHKGVRSYKMAREGEVVIMKKHSIKIHNITLIEYKYPDIKFSVTCSTGTYVRSLIHDIGQQLTTGAYMVALKRTEIGFINVSAALSSENIHKETVVKYTVSIEETRIKLFNSFLDQKSSKL